MLKGFCDKCSREITETFAFIVIRVGTNKQYQLCSDCGEKAIKPLTRAEMIDIFLNDLKTNRQN